MFTRYATSLALLIVVPGTVPPAGAQTLREAVLRQAALDAGFVPAEETHVEVDPKLVAAGQLVFQTRKLSLDGEIACASCHLDRFGSADGLPNAIGTGGRGEGIERLLGGGDVIPRNALPFWGRGSKGFDVFFWDGRVDGRGETVRSQFAGAEPSDDPLVVAAHLPPVEIGEMLLDSAGNESFQQESVGAAEKVYKTLAERLANDDVIGPALVRASGKAVGEVKFVDAAISLAAFIRHNFRLKPTRFHDFVFGAGQLTSEEIAGGILFYGKARCAACHNGPYFSDLDFHAIPFPQAGFGRNGFGVDLGRYNVTLDVDDLYKFRTPPLYNVPRTAPYGHSGSLYDLSDAIRAHVDPLSVYDTRAMNTDERTKIYEGLKRWASEAIYGVSLTEGEIDGLIAFLGTLSFDSDAAVEETD